MADTTAYEETMPVTEELQLLQEDIPLATVPVEVVNDARVYQLPARRAQTGTDLVSDTTPVEVLSANTKRSRALLVSIDGPMFVQAGKSAAGAWPQNVPYEVTHCAAITVRALTAASSTRIGWTAEYWAD
jgi:hypothetical protein